jgi:hypothetical protein
MSGARDGQLRIWTVTQLNLDCELSFQFGDRLSLPVTGFPVLAAARL